jgi:hypothetical protein
MHRTQFVKPKNKKQKPQQILFSLFSFSSLSAAANSAACETMQNLAVMHDATRIDNAGEFPCESRLRNALNNQRRPTRTKTASEQSSPKSENSPRKLRELMKRNAGFMAKASMRVTTQQRRPLGWGLFRQRRTNVWREVTSPAHLRPLVRMRADHLPPRHVYHPSRCLRGL